MLVCVDIFSRQGNTRVIKSKSGVDVSKAFESIFDTAHKC